MKFKKLFKQDRKGVSIIIALFIVSAFMLQMAATSEQIRTSLEIHSNRTNNDQAYWNARSALELALYQQTHSDKKDIVEQIKKTAFPDADNTADWTVTNTANASAAYTFPFNNEKNNFYSPFPLPGTGTVGGKYCNPQNVPKDKTDLQFLKDISYFMNNGNIDFTSSNDAPGNVTDFANRTDVSVLDDPCFWNTLDAGKPPVSVPLYVKSNACPADQSGENICNPSDVEMKDLVLRIRMPCKNGSAVCAAEDRWQLDAAGPGDALYDKRVVLWDISGKCFEETKSAFCYLTNATEANDPSGKVKSSLHNETIITGSSLNGDQYHMLNQQLYFNKIPSTTVYQYGFNLNDVETLDQFLLDPNITKPTLHLSLAAKLQTTDPAIILQHLEYQLLYIQNKKTMQDNNDVLNFISDPYIIATGSYKGFQTKLDTHLSQPSGSFGYAFISN